MSCENYFTEESNTYIHPPVLSDVPPYICPIEDTSSYSGMASSIMNSMLLTQYANSPNLIEFIEAYVKEMDTLMFEIKNVELGRYIQNAVGAQLDVIGVILQQSRNINIPTLWFGFQGATPIAGMSDEATPNNGGVFISEDQQDFELTPLNDADYRNVLLCRGWCMNQVVFDINTIYKSIELILGVTPNTMRLVEVGEKDWLLELPFANVSNDKSLLVLAISHWFIPMGITFNISLV